MNCVQCNEPAYVRCRKHRQHLCGTRYCVDLHRWAGGSCEFVESSKPLRGWRQHILATLVALGVGLLVVSVLVI